MNRLALRQTYAARAARLIACWAAIPLAIAFTGCAEKTVGSAPPPRAARPAPQSSAEWVAYVVAAAAEPESEAYQAAQEAFERACMHAAAPSPTSAPAGASASASGVTRRELADAMCTHLDAQTPRAARIWFLRQLTLVGDEECVTPLSKLMSDEDAEIADLARRALEMNPGRRTTQAIVRFAMIRDEAAVRIACLNSLGACGGISTRAGTVLAGGSKDGQVILARAACAACGGDVAMRAAVAGLSMDNEERDDFLITPSLFRSLDVAIQSRQLNEGAGRRKRSIVAQYFRPIFDGEKLLTRREWRVARLMYAHLLLNVGGESISEALQHYLCDERNSTEDSTNQRIPNPYGNPVVGPFTPKDAAVLEGIIAHAADPRIDAFLLNAAREPGCAPLARLLPILAIRGIRAELNWARILESGNEDDRAAAVRYLGEFGSAADVPLLERVAADGAGAPRELAERALARLPGQDVDARIVADAQNAELSAAQRVVCIHAVAARYQYLQLSVLQELAARGADEIRAAAFEALGELAPQDQLPGVLGLAIAADTDQSRTAGEDAVVRIAAKIEDRERRADLLLAALPKEQGAAREHLIRAVGRIGGAASLAAVRAALRDENPRVVDAAVRAVSNWPDAAALEDALRIAESSADDTHRALALRAFVRMLRLPSARPVADQFRFAQLSLRLARDAGERKLAIGALGDVPLIESLEVLRPLSADAEVQSEAASAVVRVARAVAAQDRALAQSAMAEVAALPGLAESLSVQVRDAQEMLEKFSNYIGEWSIAGPYHVGGKKAADLYDVDFAPMASPTSAAWRPLTCRSAENPWIFDFTKLDEASDRCIYARTHISIPRAVAARLLIGSDDGCIVYLNGKVVHRNVIQRGLEPGSDKVDVELNRGENTIIIKVMQASGGWGFCCGVVGADGKPIDGLTVAP